jgi:hypothetical protein
VEEGAPCGVQLLPLHCVTEIGPGAPGELPLHAASSTGNASALMMKTAKPRVLSRYAIICLRGYVFIKNHNNTDSSGIRVPVYELSADKRANRYARHKPTP